MLYLSSRIIIARVFIMPENKLPDSLYSCRSLSLDKYRLCEASTKEPPAMPLVAKNRVYDKQYKIPCSTLPTWVHRSYDLQYIAQRVLLELRTSIFVDVGSGTIVPLDPIDLSYWVIQNLPLDDDLRLQLLSINNANQRLRAELTILQRVIFLPATICIVLDICKVIFALPVRVSLLSGMRFRRRSPDGRVRHVERRSTRRLCEPFRTRPRNDNCPPGRRYHGHDTTFERF